MQVIDLMIEGRGARDECSKKTELLICQSVGWDKSTKFGAITPPTNDIGASSTCHFGISGFLVLSRDLPKMTVGICVLSLIAQLKISRPSLCKKMRAEVTVKAS